MMYINLCVVIIHRLCYYDASLMILIFSLISNFSFPRFFLTSRIWLRPHFLDPYLLSSRQSLFPSSNLINAKKFLLNIKKLRP